MINTDVGILTVPELEALVSLNVDLVDRYQAIADDPDAELQTRRTAAALAAWRRRRARYFQQECADTERVEAMHESNPSTGQGPSSRPAQPQDRPTAAPPSPRHDGPAAPKGPRAA
jgi:hypothetical protein